MNPLVRHPFLGRKRSRDELPGFLLAGVGLGVAGGLWWAWSAARSHRHDAPGAPGETPHWNFAGKDGVGTALSHHGPSDSRVWFTLRDGAFTEIFYPSADLPAVRELRLVVTDAAGRFIDERFDTRQEIRWTELGIPAFDLTNTARDGSFRIEKNALAHPQHDSVLQSTRFVPLVGTLDNFRVFVYLAPQLNDQGKENTAWIDRHRGMQMLFASQSTYALAMACSAPWLTASAGYVGRSDGLSDVRRYGSLRHAYERAESGNVALIGEVDLRACDGRFTIALGFGTGASEAAHRARAGVLESFSTVRDRYVEGWRETQATLEPSGELDGAGRDLSRESLAVLWTHQDKCISGALVASLSVPWGASRSDDGTGLVGYHIVWPRDLVECGGAMLACGSKDGAIRLLRYLHATQHADGHWSQNFWVDGSTAWESNQMGETALPVLLYDLIVRDASPDQALADEIWPMIRSAASFIVRKGPSSLEDRWEDVHGFTPYTISALVAALLAASSLACRQGDSRAARYLQETADNWCDNIEYWTYVKDTPLSRRVGVAGYYVRVAPTGRHGEAEKRGGLIKLWYEPITKHFAPAESIVSPDALAYVRFGLRAADDPRVVDTVKVIDAELRVETPNGPSWYRSSDDGYGEKRDGAPFDDHAGIGRLWPLLTGERGHYELAAGRRDEALRLLHAMENFANATGMIPEQVWDTDDIPSRGLFKGCPSGSAMPLAWAHAEYLKLRRSLADGRVYDMHPEVHDRYVVRRVGSPFVIWRPTHQRSELPCGKDLRVEFRGAATLSWYSDHDAVENRAETVDTGLGIHVADLATAGLPESATMSVSIRKRDPRDPAWQEVDTPGSFRMTVVDNAERGTSIAEPVGETSP